MYVISSSGASAPRTISGRSLSHRKLNARQRAVIAAEILNGEAVLQPSEQQLSKLLGVSIPYIEVACRLTPAKRQAIKRGIDATPFADLLKPASPAPVRIAIG